MGVASLATFRTTTKPFCGPPETVDRGCCFYKNARDAFAAVRRVKVRAGNAEYW